MPRKTGRLILFAPVVIASVLVLPTSRSEGFDAAAQDCPREAARFSHASLEYRSWVTQYRQGNAEAAQGGAAALTTRRLDDVLAGAFLPTLCRADPPWGPAEVSAAAMLETEITEGLLGAQAFESMMLRLGVAQRFLSHLALDERPFVERWFVAVSRRLRLAGLVSPWAGEFLISARKAVPASAPVLFESGLVAELSAGGASSLRLGRLSSPLPAVANLEREKFYRAALNDGIEWLAEAARLEPRHRAVRLHLARLLLAVERDKEAAALLEALVAEDPDDGHAYVARLILGSARERAGTLQRR